MIDHIIQNFNWPTFFIALAVFVLASNLYNMLISYIFAKRAKKKEKMAEGELQKLYQKLHEKDAELKDLLSRGEDK